MHVQDPFHLWILCHNHVTHHLKKKHFSRGCKYKYRQKETVKLIVQTFLRKKIKVEGSMTLENIFSSIMADFRAVVSVLPCSPTNKGKKNLCGCAEKANRQWAFVAFWLSSYVNIKTAAAFADWLAPKKGRTFQFNLFLWVILRILHST